MKAKELLNAISYEWNQKGSLDISIGKITGDSRKVERGDVFVALRGTAQDGHLFLGEAMRRGAALLVVENNYKDRSMLPIASIFAKDSKAAFRSILLSYHKSSLSQIKLIGVTGTNGKTTSAYLICHLLNQIANCGMIGTVEYLWGAHRIKASNTTPGLETFLELLSAMVCDHVSFCVSEVSSHALDQGRVSGLQFESAIFTNLTQDHMDYHKSFDHYFESKKKLFTQNPPPRFSIVNSDDSYGKKLLSILGSDALSFGRSESAKFQIQNIRTSLAGSEFDLLDAGTSELFRIKTHLPLLHNIYNVTGALLAVKVLGFPLNNLIKSLDNFMGVPGRMQPVSGGVDFLVFVDYAHTPDAFENVFSSVRQHVKGKLITVFGCGGNRDKLKRPAMGKIAAQYADSIFLTNDNPRNESPDEILRDIKQGIAAMSQGQVKEIQDRREAIEAALKSARPNDAVLILGKGHETEQIVGECIYEISDQKIVQDYFKSLKV